MNMVVSKLLQVFFFLCIFAFASAEAQVKTSGGGGGGLKIGERIPAVVNVITRKKMIEEFREIINLTEKLYRSLKKNWKEAHQPNPLKDEKKVDLVVLHNMFEIILIETRLAKANNPQVDLNHCPCADRLKVVSGSSSESILNEILKKEYLREFLMYQIDPGLSSDEALGVKATLNELFLDMRGIKWQLKR